MKLLQIDASPRQDSVSRQLTSLFPANWKQQVPGGQVVHRDLATSPLGLVTDDWIRGAHSNPEQHTAAHRSALQYSDKLIEELQAADVVVIGDPMHNFTISTRLKAWLDQVVRFGKTISYGESGQKGWCWARKCMCSLRVAAPILPARHTHNSIFRNRTCAISSVLSA